MTRAVRTILVIVSFLTISLVGLGWALFALGWEEVETLRWDKPYWLIALVAVPVVLILGTLGEDRRIPRLRIGNLEAARAAPGGIRSRLRDVPGVLRAASLALIAIALARPQSLAAAEIDERSGIDIMVVLDLSGSMRAADLKPTRLDAAKAVVQELIERRADDRIGAVIFAKEAFLLSPLTFDHARLATLVGKMQMGIVSGDGTAIGDGLATALARLRRSKASTRVIVLLTDGDSNAGSMSPEYATAAAKELGVKIYTVQMGNGDEVDVEIDKDAFGRPIYGRAKFPVNPELLKKIASETGGETYIADDTEELRSSMHAILDGLAKTRFEAASSDVVERFPLALIPGVALVLVEALLRALILRRYP
ncbi:MAG: VWA domain-containing protein [Polyangiales bacterium]